MRDVRPLTRNLGSPSAVRQFFEECMATVDLRRETMWVAHLDKKDDCVFLERYQGDEASAPCPYLELLFDAFEHDSASIVLAHNHPSGRVGPSMQDIRMTRQLAEYMKLLNCSVLDHLIFAGSGCTSFREFGLL